MGGGELHIRFVSSVGAHGRWVSWWSLFFRTFRKVTLDTEISGPNITNINNGSKIFSSTSQIFQSIFTICF